MVKIVKALEDADVLMKALPILPMLLATLDSSLIDNLLTGKGMYRAGTGNKCICGQVMYRAGEGKGLFRAG